MNSHALAGRPVDSFDVTPADEVRLSVDNFHPVHCFGENAPDDNWRRFPVTGAVVDADPPSLPVEQTKLFRSLRAVVFEGVNWEDTEFFKHNAGFVSDAVQLWGASNPSELLDRLRNDIPRIMRSMSMHGYLTQERIIRITEADGGTAPDLAPFKRGVYYDYTDEDNELKVGIDPLGRVLLLEGQHRMAVARLLNIARVPVIVVYRHRTWSNLRRRVAQAAIDSGEGFAFRHPDLEQFCLPAGQAMDISSEMLNAGISISLKPMKSTSGTQAMPKVISRAAYDARTAELGTGHWHNASRRWIYHSAAACLAQIANPSSPSRVLEMGTMGINIVPGSDTIDYDIAWQFAGKSPTYVHDARIAPWPVADDAYELFIGLRVFHHLSPNQEAAFHEAKRVASHIIICTPEAYDKVPGSKGIANEEWIRWNGGVPPTAIMELTEEFGNLYYWDAKALGR
jgi:hypothetical protein